MVKSLLAILTGAIAWVVIRKSEDIIDEKKYAHDSPYNKMEKAYDEYDRCVRGKKDKGETNDTRLN